MFFPRLMQTVSTDERCLWYLQSAWAINVSTSRQADGSWKLPKMSVMIMYKLDNEKVLAGPLSFGAETQCTAPGDHFLSLFVCTDDVSIWMLMKVWRLCWTPEAQETILWSYKRGTDSLPSCTVKVNADLSSQFTGMVMARDRNWSQSCSVKNNKKLCFSSNQ